MCVPKPTMPSVWIISHFNLWYYQYNMNRLSFIVNGTVFSFVNMSLKRHLPYSVRRWRPIAPLRVLDISVISLKVSQYKVIDWKRYDMQTMSQYVRWRLVGRPRRPFPMSRIVDPFGFRFVSIHYIHWFKMNNKNKAKWCLQAERE